MPASKYFTELIEEELNITDELLKERYGKSSLPKEYLIQLEKQYNKWRREQNAQPKTNIPREQVRDEIIRDLAFVSKMDAKEYVLFQKWSEIQRNRHAINYKNFTDNDAFSKAYFNDETFRETVDWYLRGFPDKSFKPSKELKSYRTLKDAQWKIWQPMVLDEFAIEDIHPEIIPCVKDTELTQFWNLVRTYTHRMINNSNIGRSKFFIVKNKFTENPGEGDKVLGLFALSSDYMDLTPRDEYIGWSREVKTKKRMINHTAVA
ncbi:MAG: Druantia anti-phage system protein DruA, partial [Bacteroidota bacterium]